MRNKMYKEKQSFWTWWLLILFAVILYLQLSPLYANNWSIDRSGYIGLGILLAVIILFLVVRLHTVIDQDGVSIRFLPFVRRKSWLWGDIAEIYIKTYSIADYGGWGYRVGKNGTAYNTKGKYGLQLVLKNGARIMIGTQNPEEVKSVVDSIRKKI